MNTRASRAIRSMVNRDAWAIAGEARRVENLISRTRETVRFVAKTGANGGQNGRVSTGLKGTHATPASGAEHGRQT
jgi:hypothetical protein